ncbi:MAG: hypothetical protein K5745_07770 [Saccharofermentans sp.]|nr:hypothetical protein [Saccharofermentans sp.]
MDKKKGISRSSLALFTLLVIVTAAALSIFAWWQIHNYELGVAELYAEEQDGYVEVVARQIELYGDIAGDSFVEDTISLLDSTSRRYWTLDNSEYFLFVKSIGETNTYKTFSTDTFYNTTSAQDFLADLIKGQANHSIIRIGDDKYVASGTIFEYEGVSYRLCLLTDYDVMLTNNEYLSSKLYLLIDFIFLIALLIMAVILFVILITKERHNTMREKETAVRLGKYVDYLDKVVMGRNKSLIVTGEGKIAKLIHKIDSRDLYPCAFVNLTLPEEDMLECFENMSEQMDKSVIWIRYKKDSYLLAATGKTDVELASLVRGKLEGTGLVTPMGIADGKTRALDIYNKAINSQEEIS